MPRCTSRVTCLQQFLRKTIFSGDKLLKKLMIRICYMIYYISNFRHLISQQLTIKTKMNIIKNHISFLRHITFFAPKLKIFFIFSGLTGLWKTWKSQGIILKFVIEACCGKEESTC